MPVYNIYLTETIFSLVSINVYVYKNVPATKFHPTFVKSAALTPSEIVAIEQRGICTYVFALKNVVISYNSNNFNNIRYFDNISSFYFSFIYLMYINYFVMIRINLKIRCFKRKNEKKN